MKFFFAAFAGFAFDRVCSRDGHHLRSILKACCASPAIAMSRKMSCFSLDRAGILNRPYYDDSVTEGPEV